MRSSAKFLLLGSGSVVLAGGLLFVGGCLSTPRDFASPQTSIRIIDRSGSPFTGIEVTRSWYDSDTGKEGRDDAMTDQTGASRFSKIPASVGWFTGAWRRAYSRFGMCSSGNGTQTRVSIRYPGRYDVLPQGKPLHSVGQSFQDPDGVWFVASADRQSNTVVELTFPSKSRTIDYVLSSSPRGH
jgi:hypothetical protein